MENLNLNKQRLIAIGTSIVALISMILPWQTYKVLADFFGNTKNGSITGFNGWGWISLLGILAVVIASLLGDKMKPYDANSKMIALGGFGGVVLGALIFMIRVMSATGTSIGFGLFICIVVGLVGLAFVSGILNQFIQQKTSSPGSTAPPPPPPASPK